MLATDDSLQINVKGSLLSGEKAVKQLGITVGKEFSFEPHLNKICKKIMKKIHGLIRASKFLSKKKSRVIMRAFITSQFSHCT